LAAKEATSFSANSSREKILQFANGLAGASTLIYLSLNIDYRFLYIKELPCFYYIVLLKYEENHMLKRVIFISIIICFSTTTNAFSYNQDWEQAVLKHSQSTAYSGGVFWTCYYETIIS